MYLPNVAITDFPGNLSSAANSYMEYESFELAYMEYELEEEKHYYFGRSQEISINTQSTIDQH